MFLGLGLGLGVTAIRRAGAATVELSVSVAASADDAYENTDTDVVDINDTTLTIALNRLTGFRFQNVTIPQGATISSASVQFTAAGSIADSILSIHGEDSDDAAAFQAVNVDISGRTQTTASVSWTVPAWSGSGARTAAQATPDLATIIQEIVDRAGWVSGNDLALLFLRTGGTANPPVAAEEHATLQPATLTVRYTA